MSAAASPQVWAPDGLQADSQGAVEVGPRAETPDEQSAFLLNAAAASSESHCDSQVSSREWPCEPESGLPASIPALRPDWSDFQFEAGSPDDAHSAVWPWDVPFPDELQAVLQGVLQDGLQGVPQDDSRVALRGESQAVPRACSRGSLLPVLHFPPACSLTSPQSARGVQEQPAGNPPNLWPDAVMPRAQALRGSPWRSFAAHFLPG